jgi:hypothetical protein
MKLKLKGRRFDTSRSKPNRRVLDTLIEKDFQEAFQKWRRWDRCYMGEGTTSRVTATDRPYGEIYDFYSVSP